MPPFAVKQRGREGRPLARSVFAWQQEGRRAAIGLGDNPKRIVAKAPARFALINRIGRQDAIAVLQGVIVGRGVFFIDHAPITSSVSCKAFRQPFMTAGLDCAQCRYHSTYWKGPLLHRYYSNHCFPLCYYCVAHATLLLQRAGGVSKRKAESAWVARAGAQRLHGQADCACSARGRSALARCRVGGDLCRVSDRHRRRRRMAAPGGAQRNLERGPQGHAAIH